MYIDNGSNIDAGWTRHLAVSVDGNKWELISKEGLDVRPVHIIQNTSSALVNKREKCIIRLVRGEMDNTILEFDVENVQNQAGWTGGATLKDDCEQAVIDIGTWLADGMGGGGTGNILYATPQPEYTTSYDTYDEGWHYINGTYSQSPTTDDIFQSLDEDDYFKVVHDIGSHGHNYRFLGLNNGYYNSDDGNYYDSSDVLSSLAAEFSTDQYVFDRLTGLAYRRVRGGSVNYATALTSAQSATWNGFTNWYLPFKGQMDALVNEPIGSLLLYATNHPVFDLQLNAKTCTPTAGSETTQTWLYLTSGAYSANRAKTNTDVIFYVRKAY
jgi:hypothetical protein